MAVGHLLLQSFWPNEAIFQLMMLTYNLFLFFKMDFAFVFKSGREKSFPMAEFVEKIANNANKCCSIEE